jgi:hypothetical protein
MEHTDTYIKKRWALLVFAIVLFGILSYQLAIKHTLEIGMKYLENRVHASGIDNKENIANSEILILNKYLNVFQSDSVIVRKNLLDSLNRLSNNYTCAITNFPISYTSIEYNNIILNSVFELEGSYFNLIKIIHSMENNQFYGKINASKFFVKEDLRTKKKSLFLQVYLQHIVKK